MLLKNYFLSKARTKEIMGENAAIERELAEIAGDDVGLSAAAMVGLFFGWLFVLCVFGWDLGGRLGAMTGGPSSYELGQIIGAVMLPVLGAVFFFIILVHYPVRSILIVGSCFALWAYENEFKDRTVAVSDPSVASLSDHPQFTQQIFDFANKCVTVSRKTSWPNSVVFTDYVENLMMASSLDPFNFNLRFDYISYNNKAFDQNVMKDDAKREFLWKKCYEMTPEFKDLNNDLLARARVIDPKHGTR